MFHGPPHSNTLYTMSKVSETGFFYFEGLFVAVSFANGGRLSETVYSYMCHGLYLKRLPSNMDDISDEKIKASMLKVQYVY